MVPGLHIVGAALFAPWQVYGFARQLAVALVQMGVWRHALGRWGALICLISF